MRGKEVHEPRLARIRVHDIRTGAPLSPFNPIRGLETRNCHGIVSSNGVESLLLLPLTVRAGKLCVPGRDRDPFSTVQFSIRCKSDL